MGIERDEFQLPPVSPGEILGEELEVRHLTRRDLAAKMGRSIRSVNEIVNAKAAITPETALDLERVLGVSAGFWVRAEAMYRLALAREKRQESA